MRLGQLARKYSLTQEEIILFLNEVEPQLGSLHHNTKLNDDSEALIASHFNISIIDEQEVPEVPTDEIKSEVSEILVEEEVEESYEDTEASLQQDLDPSLPPIKTPEPTLKNEKAIDSARLMELLEDEEGIVDLSDITIIKAPKKELEGLKVVGKIELPEPKVKPEQKEEPINDNTEAPGKRQGYRKKISNEEREEKRLRAKKKKEEYEARQEKRRKADEIKRKKAQKKSYYDQKIQKNKSPLNKPKTLIKKQEIRDEVLEAQIKPKSFLGKFWRWFWHGE